MTSPHRILHCLRAPVGGLFRHVRDLATAQARAGNHVGIICDSATGGDTATSSLDALAEHCALGVRRVPMSRQLGLRDFSAWRAVREFASTSGADVLHGHGAKGGAYARLAVASLRRRAHLIVSFYTPHGGSLHYDPKSPAGRLFITLERWLAPHSDGLIFESRYSAGLYENKVGPFPCPHFIVPNGLWPEEFEKRQLSPNPTDFLFVGELRHLKGVDVLIAAAGGMETEHPISLVIVGAGPDADAFKTAASSSKINGSVTFAGVMPAAKAFGMGRCLVVPSRAESFPYIVLEAAAAQVPMILTNVGGIPEITAGTEMQLLEPGNVEALQDSMKRFLKDPAEAQDRAVQLQSVVSQRYSVAGMSTSIGRAYDQVLSRTAD